MWSIPTTHPMTVAHSSCITVIAKPLGSHDHCRNNPLAENFSNEIFRQPLLRRVDTPQGSLEPKLLIGAKIFSIKFLMRLHAIYPMTTNGRLARRKSDKLPYVIGVKSIHFLSHCLFLARMRESLSSAFRGRDKRQGGNKSKVG